MTESNNRQPAEVRGDAPFSLREALSLLVSNWKWLVGITFVFAAAAVATALILTPMYRVEVLVSPVKQSEGAGKLAELASQFGGLVSAVGLDLAGGSDKEVTIAVLRSRQFIEEFVTDKDLLPVIFHDMWNAERREWDVEAAAIPSLADAYEMFVTSITSVREDKRTGLVVVAVEWSDRHLAMEWANELVERLNRRMRDRAITKAQKSIEFLNAEAEKSNNVELRQAIYRVVEGQINTIMMANVTEEFALEVIDPAALPDEDDIVRPRRVLIVLLGTALGGFLAMLFVLLRQSWRSGARSMASGSIGG